MMLNDPDLTALLARRHDAYEQALAANDVEALGAFFWDSPLVVRYGVAEQLYGTAELRSYRQAHTPPYTERRVVRRVITVFGSSLATVMSEIELTIAGAHRRSRQSQTWVSFPDLGWCIVAAHVSIPATSAEAFPWGPYADAAARTLNLPINAHRAGVVGNLERTAAIAAPLLAFALPDETEPAPVFGA